MLTPLIKRLFGALNNRVGNLPSLPGIFPDYPAPIVRNAPDGREIVMARWGMPTSQVALMEATKKRAVKLEGKCDTVDFKDLLRLEPDSGVTNILNAASRHWQLAGSARRTAVCAVHVISEYDTIDGKKVPSGLRSTKAARCSPSPGSGPTGHLCERPRKARSQPMSTAS